MTVRTDQFHAGIDVFDRDGERLGKATEALPDGSIFHLETGFLGLGKSYDVPFSAIREVVQDRAYLKVRKDQLDHLDRLAWDQRVDRTADTPPLGVEQLGRTVPLREDELQVRKMSVQTGQLSVGKKIVEAQRSMDVPVTREEVYVERRPLDRRPTDQPIGAEETIRVPLHEEQVTLEKQPVVYQEVGVGKRQVPETRTVSATVRREELRVDRAGDVNVDVDVEGEGGGGGDGEPRP